MVTYYDATIAQNVNDPDRIKFLTSFCDLTKEQLINLIDLVSKNGLFYYGLIIKSHEEEE